MDYLRRFIQTVYTIYGFIIFTGVLLLIFPLALLASFFGKIRGGNFIYKLCEVWASFVLFCIGIKHRTTYESPHDTNKQYVFVFNHISFLDAAIIVKSIGKQPIRALGKAEMAKVPLFGFLYKYVVVLVERDKAEKRAKSVIQLKSVLKKGISILLSPEGTFNLTGKPLKEFYDGAFKIAIETQTPIKPVLFLDTFDRMHYRSVFSLNPGRSRAVYLDEVKVDGLTLQDVPFLKAKVYSMMEAKLIQYKASWIKKDKEKSGEVNID